MGRKFEKKVLGGRSFSNLDNFTSLLINKRGDEIEGNEKVFVNIRWSILSLRGENKGKRGKI
jgi:hypothetical protein